MSGDAEPIVRVRLLDLPLALQAKSQQHADELIRELTLIAEQLRSEGEVQALPPRLVDLVGELTARYGGLTAEAEERIEQAGRRGEESVDVEMNVPVSVGLAARHLGEILDEADEYCRAGRHLLTLATPPDAVRYRRWYLGEFIRQTDGQPPRPWPQFSGAVSE